MKWFNTNGRENDVVVSTRIRFARNISGYPFTSKLSEGARAEIVSKVCSALPDCKRVDIAKADKLTRYSLYEKHLISREFAKEDGGAKALLCDEENGIYVMTPEEDHIRIQCIMSGLELDEAYKRASQIEEKLDRALPLAYNDRIGYLTHCPTNAGTGLRASVMLFLPAMASANMIRSLALKLDKRGLTIRGMYGEGSGAEGCLYQISNQVTLKISEAETVSILKETVNQITDKERALRGSFKGDEYLRLSDRLMRSYGILKYANLITSEEMLSLYTDVRLAAALKLIKLPPEKLDELLISSMPATISLGDDKLSSSAVMRDKARAELAHSMCKEQ